MKLRFSATIFVAILFAVSAAADEAAESEPSNDETVKPLGPITEPPIKLVHVLNPGEREYLSPNLIGLQNIAMTFLPLTMNFVNIIDAFREIVNGVRYEIVANAVDTKQNNKEIICRLVILEKPWLRTEWGDKVRELVNSNCTSDIDNLADPSDKVHTLNDKYPRNAVFNGGTRNELSDEEMAKLESQILPFSKDIQHVATNKATSKTSTSTSTTSTTTTTTTTTTTERPKIVQQSEVSESNGQEDSTTLPTELNDTAKKWIDSIFSVGAVNFENSRREQQQNEAKSISNTASANNYKAPAASAASEDADVQQQQIEEQDYVVEDTQQQQQQEEDFQVEQVMKGVVVASAA